MMNTKKTALVLTGAAAAGLLTLGAVAPAMADSGDDNSSSSTTSATKILGDVTAHDFLGDVSNSSPVGIAPQVGDVASGNAVGSGNDVSAPLVSGNETSVGNGTSVGTDVVDLVDSSVGDISGDVSDIVGDATSGIDLGAILGD